jgi:hypothetical protein
VARLSSERKTFLALANLPDWLEKGIWKVDRMIRGSPRMLYAARSRGRHLVGSSGR